VFAPRVIFQVHATETLSPFVSAVVVEAVTELVVLGGFGLNVGIVAVGAALPANVTVIAGELPVTVKVHGLVAFGLAPPEQLMLAPASQLQVAKTEPPAGCAVNEPVALLFERLMDEQV
jgi:hypothetical protein